MRRHAIVELGLLLAVLIASAHGQAAPNVGNVNANNAAQPATAPAATRPMLTDEQRADLARLIDGLRGADLDECRRTAAAVRKIGPAALPMLIDALSDREMDTRSQVRRMWLAEVLAEFGPEAAPATAALVALLRTDVGYSRHSALFAISKIGPGARLAAPELVKIITRPRDPRGNDVTDRIDAIRAAGAIGPDANAAVDGIVEALTDRNELVRLAAANALGQMGPGAGATAPALVLAFKDANRNVSGAAVMAIAKLGPAAARHLAGALAGSDLTVRKSALDALFMMGPQAAPASAALVAELRSAKDIDQRYRVLFVLMQIGEPAFADLGALLKDPDEQVRFWAVTVLGRLRPPMGGRWMRPDFSSLGPALPEAVPLIVTAMKDASAVVRQQSAAAMGRVRPVPVASLGKLQAMLKDPAAVVRTQAAKSLGGYGPAGAAAVPALIDTLTETDPDAAQACRQALLDIRVGVVDAMIAAMTRPIAADRRFDAGVLAKIGKSAAGPLARLLTHKDALVRGRAVAALGFMGPPAAEAAAGLAALLTDSDAGMAYAAAEALGKIGPDANSAAVALAEALKDRRNSPMQPGLAAEAALKAMGPAASSAIPELVKVTTFHDPNTEYGDEDVRVRAIDALAAMGPAAARAVPALRAAMKQTNRAVRWHSADALGRIGPRAGEAVGDLVAIVKDPNDHVYVRGRATAALGGIGAADDRVVPALIWALGNDELRYHAVYALGLLGPAAKPAADAIRDIAARETDRWRKEAADAALKKIMAGPATRT